jgi:ABC-2 type transport system permease protein
MKREGSPFKGAMTVAFKEAADHMTSARIHVIMLLVLLTAIGAVYAAICEIKQSTPQSSYLFLNLFAVARDPLPSFASFMGFLLPMVAIGLGFDSVNGEVARRTMSHILAQPIYRNAVLFGKLAGGMVAIAIALLMLWLLAVGLGILTLGQPPSGVDVIRGLAYLAVALVYTGVWLAFAMALSAAIRAPATSALWALSAWLFFALLWPILVPVVANALNPAVSRAPASVLSQFALQQGLARLSPVTLYGEIAQMLLDPTSRSVVPALMTQFDGVVIGAPLSTWQSIIIVWPQFAGLFTAMVLLFTGAYVVFQRREIRS